MNASLNELARPPKSKLEKNSFIESTIESTSRVVSKFVIVSNKPCIPLLNPLANSPHGILLIIEFSISPKEEPRALKSKLSTKVNKVSITPLNLAVITLPKVSH